jgi:outer membrane protein assembly factor BamE (lipoprotein component of BamABCDE complex)
MFNRLLSLLLIFSLSSCSFFHVRKQTIEQGNHFTSEEVSQLRVGMSPGQVIAVMGNPALTSTLTPHQLVYVYTYDNHKSPLIKKQAICTFENGQLKSVKTR